jgi:hypothetical protein
MSTRPHHRLRHQQPRRLVTARYWLEAIAGVPCTSRSPANTATAPRCQPAQLIVAISQSGETADTLAALRHAKSLGQTKTLAICNVPESAIVRECALRFITRAGPEIGVASTKAFTTQLAALFVLTLVMAKIKQRLTRTGSRLYRSTAPPAGRRATRCSNSNRKSKPGPSASPTSTTPCSSAAAGTIRSPWKARSSSRKSPTSTPKPTRPAN